MTDLAAPRTRRAILAATLGGAAAAVASALGRPAAALAADGDPVVVGQSSSGTQTTTITGTVDPVVTVSSTGAGVALNVAAAGDAITAAADGGIGVLGQSDKVAGVFGQSLSVDPVTDATLRNTGVMGTAGAVDNVADDTNETGVYGFSATSGGSTGVWGDTVDGNGVVGTGYYGVYGTGRAGVVGDVDPSSTGVYAFVGSILAPDPPPAGRAVYARAYTTSQIAFEASGRVRFSRSGRVTVSKGASSKAVTMTGVTTSSYVIATLQSNQSGLYVKAVVPGTNKFTIVLSKACAASCVVGYFVIN
jgi:hypothetical protein